MLSNVLPKNETFKMILLETEMHDNLYNITECQSFFCTISGICVPKKLLEYGTDRMDCFNLSYKKSIAHDLKKKLKEYFP